MKNLDLSIEPIKKLYVSKYIKYEVYKEENILTLSAYFNDFIICKYMK
jgi:hypothetical protein